MDTSSGQQRHLEKHGQPCFQNWRELIRSFHHELTIDSITYAEGVILDITIDEYKAGDLVDLVWFDDTKELFIERFFINFKSFRLEGDKFVRSYTALGIEPVKTTYNLYATDDRRDYVHWKRLTKTYQPVPTRFE